MKIFFSKKLEVNSEKELFVKLIKLNRGEKFSAENIIKEVFGDIKGLIHYEIINYKKEKYLIFYYLNLLENQLTFKPKEFDLSIPKKIISIFSENLILDISKVQIKYNIKFFLKGKLIYSKYSLEEDLYKEYKESIKYLKSILGEKINIIESKEDAFYIYTQKEDKLKFLLKGEEKNIFKEKERL